MKRTRIFLTALLVGAFMFATPVQADVVCNTYTFTRDDDSAYNANLPFSLSLGSAEYSNVYITTNGTMTFGTPDGNFGDYPQTPSVSVAGYDWVTWGDGAYLSYGSTANTFCAEWSVRPYPRSTGELTQIRLVINRNDNGSWHGEVVTFGWLPANLRRGIRFEQGQAVVPIEAAFDVNGGVPIEVEPAPIPSSFTEPPVVPTPEPTTSPTPEPTPVATQTTEPSAIPTVEPEPTPTPTPSEIASVPVVEPTPTPSESVQEPVQVLPTPVDEPTLITTPTPTPELTPEQQPQEQLPESQVPLEQQPEQTNDSLQPPLEPTLEPTADEVTQTVIDDALADGVLTDTERELVADALLTEFAGEPITFEALQEAGLDYADLPPETPVTLENGVVLTAEVADALEIFDSGAELLATIFDNPAKAFKALANIGADMTQEERETAQNTVVAAVVVTQIAQVRKTK
jgi:hypothetical protein